tara:strand:+ start:193 stop:492 length:300 start_codon:yes stop_codon:yes gene_type:complete
MEFINMPQNERRHLTTNVPCAGAILANASVVSSYRLAKKGDLDVIQLGGKKVVPVAWLEVKLGLKPGELDSRIDAWLSENGYVEFFDKHHARRSKQRGS